MAELERVQENNLYSDVGEHVFPLFVRYSARNVEFHNKDSKITFEDLIQKMSGVHMCSFVHRRQKGKTETYDELAVKIDEENLSFTAKKAKDEFTLCLSQLSEKKLLLPDNEEEYKRLECDIRFVDIEENSFNLIRSAGSYWLENNQKITDFIDSCLKLPIPPIEIEIEDDKQMWQAYLEGLNALLENKRDLIKISHINKTKSNSIRIEFDMESYRQNLCHLITDELVGKCDEDPIVSIEDDRCEILFNSYQVIPEDSVDKIKTIGKDYCYKAENQVENSIKGQISIHTDQKELENIISNINTELQSFGITVKEENGNYILDDDKTSIYLNKIVSSRYGSIAKVRNSTRLTMKLNPLIKEDESSLVQSMIPVNCRLQQQGSFFIVSSHSRPLDENEEIFNKYRFVSCKACIFPHKLDETIKIEGATVKDGAYTWIFNTRSELNQIRKLFTIIKDKYDVFPQSTYHYAFTPQIDKSILADLKFNNYDKVGISVDVPKSSIIFSPTDKNNYDILVKDICEQLTSNLIYEIPKYQPTVEIVFLSNEESYRRSVFEQINVALAEKRNKFKIYNLNKDATSLTFSFDFDSIEERDKVEQVIELSLEDVHGIDITYENKAGETKWILEEDMSLFQELERKLQSDFRNESVNYINGKDYDKLSEVTEEELNASRYSKDSIIKRERHKYLQQHSVKLGTCIRRSRDYAIIQLNDEIIEGLRTKDFKISKGDYIQFPAMGETMELMRQSKAMGRILHPDNKYNKQPINPNLPNFIFDPKYAEDTKVDISEAMEDVKENELGNLNEKQLGAVTKSVLAKDLALIQGPPGTGKTTVIAEIIWQEIRKNPDCRILLTSQTNLAVDNALERLQGRPGIRPVRIGKPDKLEPEGKRYSLPIIDTWSITDIDKTNSVSEYSITDNAANYWMDRIKDSISNDPKYANAVKAWKEELLEKDKHTRTEFCRLYKGNVNLVAATCSICGSRDFVESYAGMFGGNDDMYFDVVIMDEASKATPLEMAVPLVLGKKIIVIGDHKQLPPMMDENTIDSALEKIDKKDLAEKLRNTDSQFKRLFESAAKVRKSIVATLDTQYRMHEQIMNTIKQFYDEELAATGGLKCGILETQDIPDLNIKGSRWHGITIDPIIRPETHALWIDVKTKEVALNPGFKNPGELEAIDLVLKALNQSDGFKKFQKAQKRPEDKEIGIITFYSAQSREIRNKYKGRNYRMDVVDRFQGMERNIVIVSTVRSNTRNNIGFAKEIERINVAFSRARRLLIVVGNKHQFESNSNYAASISNMETVSYEQLKAAVR